MMSFREALNSVFRENFLSFQGRASRAEFWWFFLFECIVFFLISFLAFSFLIDVPRDSIGGALDTQSGALDWVVFGGVMLILLLILFPFNLSVSFRRLHDINISGWWLLLLLITGFFPYLITYAQIGLLILFMIKGTQGKNRFGDDPLKNK